MAVRVKPLEFTGLGTVLSQAVFTGKNVEKVMGPTAKKFRRQREKIATRHYQNLRTVIKTQLKKGFANPNSGGSRIISTTDGEGKGVKYTTEYWSALSSEYFLRKPVSTVMWKKTGQAYRDVNGVLHGSKLKVKAHTTRPGKFKKKGKKGAKFTTEYALQFPLVGGVSLQRLMTQPFTYGDDSVASGFSTVELARHTDDVIGYPEVAVGRGNKPANRPWIAGLSGQLGSSMHRAIRKL